MNIRVNKELTIGQIIEPEELAYTLWEAVKTKLNAEPINNGRSTNTNTNTTYISTK